MNGSRSPRSMRGAQRRSNPGRLKVRMPLSETVGAPFARLTQRRGEEGGAKGLVCGYAENPWRAPTSPRRRPGPRPANESEPLRGALNKGLDPGLRRGDEISERFSYFVQACHEEESLKSSVTGSAQEFSFPRRGHAHYPNPDLPPRWGKDAKTWRLARLVAAGWG